MSSVSLFPILAVALLVGVIAGVVVLIKGRRRGREGSAPTCGQCGYNLTGSESNRCPECGTLFIEAGVTLGKPLTQEGAVGLGQRARSVDPVSGRDRPLGLLDRRS